jgi:RHS repeat-associated protein
MDDREPVRTMTAMLRTLLRTLAAAAIAVLPALPAAAGTVTYFHNDLAGSPVVATDASGQVLWRESYRPYGERLVNAPAASGNTVWFTSRRQDAETGLVYMGARYYDPVAGRFVSPDPVGFEEPNLHSFNRYAYANNNPYRYVDPDGRQATSVLGPLLPPPVRVGIGAYEAATALGAASIGSWIALKAFDHIYSEADSAQSATGGRAASADSGASEGCIYCVKGENTRSGKDYVGSTDDKRQRERDSSDGRDRRVAEVIDTYPKGDREARRAKEQKAMNDRGGVRELDNKRNEIAPHRWPSYGIKPPQ